MSEEEQSQRKRSDIRTELPRTMVRCWVFYFGVGK